MADVKRLTSCTFTDHLSCVCLCLQSNNVPVVQHPHMTHLHPLLSYSPEAFSPQRASPGFSPDTGTVVVSPVNPSKRELLCHTELTCAHVLHSGMSRTPHAACYPVSPGGVAQITHPLGWL